MSDAWHILKKMCQAFLYTNFYIFSFRWFENVSEVGSIAPIATVMPFLKHSNCAFANGI